MYFTSMQLLVADESAVLILIVKKVVIILRYIQSKRSEWTSVKSLGLLDWIRAFS